MNAESIVLAVLDALYAAEIDYLLTGSFASNYYGIPRSTQDVDFVVAVADKSLQVLSKHLPPGFQLDSQSESELFTGTVRNVVRIAGSAFAVELFRLSRDPHDQERFRRRRSVEFFHRQVSLPTPEDVVVTKLRWCRGKDIDDLRSVIAVQAATLDWPHIHRWCASHGTRAQLDKILQSLPPSVPTDRSGP